MADKKEPTATEEQAESPAAAPATESPQLAPPVQQPQQVQIDESGAVCAYANFCRVTGTPEELILAS